MAFKGQTASDFFWRYQQEGGMQSLNLDLLVAAEMSERINEASESAKGSAAAKKAVARRNRRREQRKRINNNRDLFQMMSDSGVPIKAADSESVGE